jgi:hypothetical protein
MLLPWPLLLCELDSVATGLSACPQLRQWSLRSWSATPQCADHAFHQAYCAHSGLWTGVSGQRLACRRHVRRQSRHNHRWTNGGQIFFSACRAYNRAHAVGCVHNPPEGRIIMRSCCRCTQRSGQIPAAQTTGWNLSMEEVASDHYDSCC